MTIWIIEPRDPLIVRDGRPFGPDPGARATSLAFPFPSTLAGGLRARAGLGEDGVFQYTRDNVQALKHLKQLSIRGPLLVQLTEDSGSIIPNGWLVPAPRDALLLPPGSTAVDKQVPQLLQLVPLVLPEEARTDPGSQELLLVGLPMNQDLQKPLKKSPLYWHWKVFVAWLLDPSSFTKAKTSLSELGLPGLLREQRLHVSIEADKEVAKDGMLFETSGLVFTAPSAAQQGWNETQRLALAVAAEDSEYTIHSGLTSFGGERRIVTWRKSDAELPSCPTEIELAIVDRQACRLFLLTPGCFEQGHRPTWLHSEAARYGVTIELKAITIQRSQVVSGWDLALNTPKPSRRLASGGTVFFLLLKGEKEAIRTWVRSIWMQCISDDQKDRTDGFGLAVLGTWSGNPVPLEKGDAL